MKGEWQRITDRNPTEEKDYPVRVDMADFHTSYPTVRKWKDGKWQHITSHERILWWIEGVDL